ncbi:MAG: hypothetical protein ACYDCJ_12880 [Gammaproteobacteria bacterium]
MAVTESNPAQPTAGVPAPGSFDGGLPSLIQDRRNYMKNMGAVEKQIGAEDTQAQKEFTASNAALSAEEQQRSLMETRAENEYDAALQHYNDVMQRQRFLTLNMSHGVKNFMPIAIAFGLLGTALTGGNIANGLAVLGAGLAGFATGKQNQFDNAVQSWNQSRLDALGEMKDLSAHVKEVMADSSVDLGIRLKQAQLLVTKNAFLSKHAMDVASLSEGLSRFDTAISRFQHTSDELHKRLTPQSEVNSAALQAVQSLEPPPIEPPVTQTIEHTAWLIKNAEWQKQTAILAKHVALNANMKYLNNPRYPNYDVERAIAASINDFTANGTFKPAPFQVGADTLTAGVTDGTPATSAGTVTIAGRAISMSALGAGAKKYGLSMSAFITLLKQQAARNASAQSQ